MHVNFFERRSRDTPSITVKLGTFFCLLCWLICCFISAFGDENVTEPLFSLPNNSSLSEANDPATLEVLIIGGGISGSALGFRLAQLNVKVKIAEKEKRAGGVIKSCKTELFQWEEGPNSFRPMKGILEMIEALQLKDEMIASDYKLPKWVSYKSKLYQAPSGIFSILTSNYLSLYAKISYLCGNLRKYLEKSIRDESVKDYAIRIYGEEVYYKLLDPFIQGVNAGDPSKISVRSFFGYGIKNTYKKRKSTNESSNIERNWQFFRKLLYTLSSLIQRFPSLGTRHSSQLSFNNGLSRFCDRIYEVLGPENFLLEHRLASILFDPKSSMWTAEFITPLGLSRVTAKVIVMATPAYVAEKIFSPLFGPHVSADLLNIGYAPLCVAVVAIPKEDLLIRLNGVGHLLAFKDEASRNTPILGAIWYSSLFKTQQKVDSDYEVLSFFIGGEYNPSAINLSDEELLKMIKEHLEDNSLIRPNINNLPILLNVKRYKNAIPLYHIGHTERIESLMKKVKEFQGLYLTGNYLTGSALGNSVELAYVLANEIVDYLSVYTSNS